MNLVFEKMYFNYIGQDVVILFNKSRLLNEVI